MEQGSTQDQIDPLAYRQEASLEVLISGVMAAPAFKSRQTAIDFVDLLARGYERYCDSGMLAFMSPVDPEFERKETPSGCAKFQVFQCTWLFSETGAVRVTGQTHRHLMNKRDADGLDVDGRI